MTTRSLTHDPDELRALAASAAATIATGHGAREIGELANKIAAETRGLRSDSAGWSPLNWPSWRTAAGEAQPNGKGTDSDATEEALFRQCGDPAVGTVEHNGGATDAQPNRKEPNRKETQ